MAEESVGIIENNVDLRPKEAPTPRDTWFRGYLTGNSLWPQMNEGITALTTEAVLTDPPAEWNEFFKSELTQKQIEIAGAVMSGHHKNAGVTVKDEAHATNEDKIVHPEDFQELWNRVAKRVGNTIVSFIREKSSFKYETNDLDIQEIQNFFKDPQNAVRIEELTKIMQLGAKNITSPKSHEVSRLYKSNLGAAHGNEDNQKEQEKIGKLNMLRLFSAGLAEAGITQEQLEIIGMAGPVLVAA